MKTKRFLGILLTLTMLIGLLPMMSLTAYASKTASIAPFMVTVTVKHNICGKADCSVSTVERVSYSQNGATFTYQIKVSWYCSTCYKNYTTTFSDIAVTCNDCELGTSTTVTKSNSDCTINFTFSRNAQAHGSSYITTIPATCTSTGEKRVDNCHYCSLTKTLETYPIDPDNHTGTLSEGVYTCCGAYQPAVDFDNDGYYEIYNASQLFWFAKQVNEVDRTANAKLMNDIDLENRPWTPIGSTGESSNNFRGVFDGQDHTITGLYVEGNGAGIGLFGEVRLGTVENFTIYGDVKLTSDCSYVGGVIGSAPGANGTDVPDHNGATIRNITSYVNVTLAENAHGSSFIGGFIGYANHETIIENCSWYGTLDLGIYRADSGVGGLVGRLYDKSNVTICNCGAYGTIKTSYKNGTYKTYDTIYIGGVLSFSPSGTKAVLENNLWAGSFIDDTDLDGKAHLSAFGTLNGEETVTNCYTIDSAPYLTTENVNANGITTVTPPQLASGEVAYKLGDAFGQKIGTDAYPILGGDVVYYGYEECNSTQKVYSNEEVSETLPDHKDEDKNHTCDVCTEKLSECSDEDKNCVCDVCGTSIAHKDEDADCVCDVCKTEIHIDENSDSICDKCNIASGSCGENVTWTFNETTGTITLSGTGATKDYLAKSPWFDYIGKFTNLTIENGITGLGRSLLLNCNNLETIHYLGTEEEWGAININHLNSSYVNAAAKHFCIHKEAQQATCLAGGNESGWYCETCQKYIKGGKEIPANPDNHLDEDSDHFCDFCDEVLSWCTDGDGDHLCDICKAALHVDDDCDCVCDICKEATHEDEDGDCFCNFCSAAMHIDSDGDRACDYCGESIDVAVITVNGEFLMAYTNIDEAIYAAVSMNEEDKAVLTLLKDIDVGSSFLDIYDGVFTLDLGGNEIVGTGRRGVLSITGENTHVTVTDSGTDGKIAFYDYDGNTSNVSYGIFVDNASLTLDGGIIEGYANLTDNYLGCTNKLYGVYAYNNSKFTFNGGTIKCGNLSTHNDFYGIYAMASEVTMTGGTVYAIPANIEGGAAVYGMYFEDSTAIIYGGSIHSNETDIYSGNSFTLLTVEQGKTTGLFSSNGISVEGTTLKAILDGELAYCLNGKEILLEEGQDSILGGLTTDEHVTVEVCTHSHAIYSADEIYYQIHCPVCDIVRFIEHSYENSDNICDGCRYYTASEFAISAFDKETNTATVLIPTVGTYTIVFADYEGGKLKNMQFVPVTVTYEKAEEVTVTYDFNLNTGDKIMLWKDTASFAPLCEAYIVD